MSDEDRRALLRRYKEGHLDVLPKLQRLNDRLGFSEDDGNYYKKYIEICENFISRIYNLGSAKEALKILNEEYRPLVGSKTIKESVLGQDILSEDDGWMPSEICW